MLIEVKVLKEDWESDSDPVPIIGGNKCLDFLDRGYVPRNSLTKKKDIEMKDCKTDQKYRIVLCSKS